MIEPFSFGSLAKGSHVFFELSESSNRSFRQATAVFGSTEKILENWRCVGQLRGHTSDIIDLSWSPDETRLASCSLDNLVIIWDITRKGTLTLPSNFTQHKARPSDQIGWT